ncbi:hypothetical protein D3C71_1496210 [compost metagenome]
MDPGQITGRQGLAVAHQAHGRVEVDHLPGHRGQLRMRALDRAGLAQRGAVQFRHLVRADHPPARVQAGDGLGLRPCQAHRHGPWGFGGAGGLIHLGAGGLQGQAEPLQQFTAVAGSRGKQQRGHATIPGTEGRQSGPSGRGSAT